MAKTLFIQCSSVGLSTENYFNLFYTIGGSSTLIPAVNDLNVAVSPLSAGQLIAGVTITTPDNVDQIVVNSPIGPCKDTYSYVLAPGVSPSLTPSATQTPSVTPTATPTPTVSKTVSITPTISNTASVTPTPTVTPTISTTASPSISPTISTTASVSNTPTPTPTISTTASISATPSVTPTISTTATLSPTPTISTTATLSVTPTPSISTTATLSPTPTISTTASISVTPSISTTATLSVTPSISTTATLSPTPTISTTASISVTPSISTTATLSPTPSISTTATLSVTPSISTTASISPTPTISTTASVSVTPTPSISTTASVSRTPSVTPTISTTASVSVTPSISTTASISATPSITPTISTTASISATPSITPTISTTASISVTPSISTTASVSRTPSVTPTISTTASVSSTPSATVTPTRTPTATPSPSLVVFDYQIQLVAESGGTNTGYLYRSTNFGANWTQLTSVGARTWESLAISSTGQYQTAVVLNGYIYKSTDSGTTFSQVGVSRSYTGVAMSSDGQYQTAVDGGSGGFLYTSSDYGANWAQSATTASSSGWSSVSVSSTGQYQTATDRNGYIYRSTDSGANWNAVTGAGIKGWGSVSISATGQYQTTSEVLNYYTYVSSDYGANWTQKTPDSNLFSATGFDVAISSTGQYQVAVYLGVQFPNNYVYLSTDYGVTWNGTSTGAISLGSGVSMSPSGQYLLSAGTDTSKLYRSTNFGANWTLVTLPGFALNVQDTAISNGTNTLPPSPSTTPSATPTPTISTTASVSRTPTPTISTTASVSRTPSVTPSNSAVGFQFATFTAGGAGSAPTPYTDSTTACRQSDTLTGQNLYQLPVDGGTPLVTAQLYTNVSCTTAWAPSIPGNRWFKLGRSSVYWAVEVNTSGVVQTVTACTAIPSNTPSATITPTPTVTTPATIFSRSSTDYANEYFACLGTVSGIDFLYQTPGAGGGTTPAVSAQMFTNPGLTTNWTPGGSGWYLFSYGAVKYAVLPNASGVLQTVYTCSTLPSQTPTPTITPSVTPTPTSPGVAFGKSTTTYATTNLACSGTITGTIYQPPANGTTPTVNAQLYTNSNLTTTWTPPSTSGYYLFQYGGSTKWAVGVGSSGIISSVVDCSAVPSLTPTPTPTPTISTTASVSRTPSTTPSNSQAASGFGAVGGYGNFTDACRGGAPTISIYTAPGTTVPIATTVFYNSYTLAPGTEFNGNNNWFKLIKGASTYAAQINTSGVVTDYRDCTAVPSNTPSNTPTPTPTPSTYYFFYIMDYCTGGTTIGRSLVDHALGATFEYSTYSCARITDTATPQAWTIDLDAATFVGNSCGSCPAPPPPPPPPAALYTQFTDCESSSWYILGDYSSGTYISDDVPYECLLAPSTTYTPSGTQFYNINAGTCGGCP